MCSILLIHNPTTDNKGQVHEGGTGITVDMNSEERIVEVHVTLLRSFDRCRNSPCELKIEAIAGRKFT